MLFRVQRVVHVPRLLSPRIEDDLLVGVVGMQRGNGALGGVVEERAANAVLLDAEMMRRAKERLVLPHRLALVVVNLRSSADPAWIEQGRSGIVRVERPGLRLDLGLRLAPEAIGIDKAKLHFGLF